MGTRDELESKFDDLVNLEETEYYQTVIRGGNDSVDDVPTESSDGGNKKMVALPDPRTMDVGMAQQEWPLPAKQYADAMVTLRFPVSSTTRSDDGDQDMLEKLLSQEFANMDSFGKSSNRETMSKTLYKTLANQFAFMGSGGVPNHLKGGGSITESEKFAQDAIVNKKDLSSVSKDNDNLSESEKFASPKTEAAIFALDGIDLFDAKIERKKKNHAKNSIGRYLRTLSREAQESEEEMIEITYTFTAQGTYRVSLSHAAMFTLLVNPFL